MEGRGQPVTEQMRSVGAPSRDPKTKEDVDTIGETVECSGNLILVKLDKLIISYKLWN